MLGEDKIQEPPHQDQGQDLAGERSKSISTQDLVTTKPKIKKIPKNPLELGWDYYGQEDDGGHGGTTTKIP